jgi:hypothetical protein
LISKPRKSVTNKLFSDQTRDRFKLDGKQDIQCFIHHFFQDILLNYWPLLKCLIFRFCSYCLPALRIPIIGKSFWTCKICSHLRGKVSPLIASNATQYYIGSWSKTVLLFWHLM